MLVTEVGMGLGEFGITLKLVSLQALQRSPPPALHPIDPQVPNLLDDLVARAFQSLGQNSVPTWVKVHRARFTYSRF